MISPQLLQDIRNAAPDEFWFGVAILCVLSLAGLILGFRYLRRARIIEDTPTSLIRSAAQGYVELQGRGELMPGEPIMAPLTGRRCTWWSYRIEQRENYYSRGRQRTRWKTIASAISDGCFLLVDNTGRCVVDPDGADVTTDWNDVWYGNTERPTLGPKGGGAWFSGCTYRYSESRLEPGEPLYAIGLFRTERGNDDFFTDAEAIRQRLAELKRDRAQLLERYDTNHDGQIDLKEWEVARREAKAEMRREKAQFKTDTAGLDILVHPADGRPYLLSNMPQEGLAKRCRLLALAGASAFLILGGIAVFLMLVRLTGHY